jgi:ABC-type multidrug transport system fused ATPase/permease subunit
MQALFRIEELAGGNIIVDGIDIGQVDIVTARRAFTIIPQDPFIFAGMSTNFVDSRLLLHRHASIQH